MIFLVALGSGFASIYSPYGYTKHLWFGTVKYRYSAYRSVGNSYDLDSCATTHSVQNMLLGTTIVIPRDRPPALPIRRYSNDNSPRKPRRSIDSLDVSPKPPLRSLSDKIIKRRQSRRSRSEVKSDEMKTLDKCPREATSSKSCPSVVTARTA